MVHGEPGVGKTALLEYLVDRASGCRVVSASGVQSEMELPFAALQQVCAPMLDWLERLPGPQRDALGVAFGLRAGGAPDRSLVGLATLSLLAEVATERPVLCVIDDAQWLDRASVQALGFVARRLLAEPVALVVATREPDAEYARLPELLVEGLGDGDARVLLGSVIIGPADERVRDRIMAEARGNPLALLELPRALTAAELAGGFGVPAAAGMAGRIEASFRWRLEALPAAAQRLMLVAAAEPAGEPALVWRAAERLGVGAGALASAADAGLLTIGERVTFRHPLVRSAVYRAASPAERRAVHQALAGATDPRADPDRRAWHRAQAVLGPEPRRFRPNMIVATGPDTSGFVENDWVGHEIAVGEHVRLRVTMTTGRCVTTTLPQGDLPRDSGILRTAARTTTRRSASTPRSFLAGRSGTESPSRC
jgi:hypothetical protein